MSINDVNFSTGIYCKSIFKSKCVISHVHVDFSDIKIFYLVKLNGGRQIQGILRGFDPFMNLVVDECIEETKLGERNQIGMVVGF